MGTLGTGPVCPYGEDSYAHFERRLVPITSIHIPKYVGWNDYDDDDFMIKRSICKIFY